MGVGAGLYMIRVRCRREKFTFAISSSDEFLLCRRCRMMKIIQTSGFRFFCQNCDHHHCGFIKFQNFDGQHGQADSMCQLTKFGSVRSNHLWNMAILRLFSNGGGRRLVFLSFRNFNDRSRGSNCVNVQNFI